MPLNDAFEAVLEGRMEPAKRAVEGALKNGVPAEQILNEALIPAMDEVGRRFEGGEYFVPELLVTARAMKASLDVLAPHLSEAKHKKIGRVLLGTVKGDLHDVGKNLVGIMLEGAGFEVIDIGTDVAPDQFVGAVQELKPDIVGMSALLTTTTPSMKTVIEGLSQAGLRQEVKVLVGGAPLTQSFADQIGADGYGADATSAVRRAREMLGIHISESA